MTDLPRVTYSNTGEDFSGVHAHLDQIIPEAEARLLGKAAAGLRRRPRPARRARCWSRAARSTATSCSANFRRRMLRWSTKRSTPRRLRFPRGATCGWPKRVAILRAGADALEAAQVGHFGRLPGRGRQVAARGGRRGRGSDRPDPPLLRRDGAQRRLPRGAGRARPPPSIAASCCGPTACSG